MDSQPFGTKEPLGPHTDFGKQIITARTSSLNNIRDNQKIRQRLKLPKIGGIMSCLCLPYVSVKYLRGSKTTGRGHENR